MASSLVPGPEVVFEDRGIVARSHPRAVALTLGAARRHLDVDRHTRRLVFETVSCWAIKETHDIAFDEISNVLIRYRDADSRERFSVLLEFQEFSRGELLLFDWGGPGTNVVQPTAAYWGEFLREFRGAAKPDATMLYEALRHLILPKVDPMFDARQGRPDQDVAAGVWSDVPNRAKDYDASIEREDAR
jgi:hypothetical protein